MWQMQGKGEAEYRVKGVLDRVRIRSLRTTYPKGVQREHGANSPPAWRLFRRLGHFLIEVAP